MDKILNWLADVGLNRVLPFLLILVGGLIVVKIVTKLVNKMLEKSKLEKAAHGMIRSLVKTVLYILLALMAASSLKIDVTGVLALASVATLAVSLALQDLLGNLVGGFTLVYTHPFSSGDYVEIAGQSGTVMEIGMTYTKLTTPDNKLVQIPNASVVSSEIVNYSCTGTRRVSVEISASYDTPVDAVLAALKEAISVEGILEDPAVFAAVTSYGDHAIHYVVRAWCPTEIYWDVHFQTIRNIKIIFDREGLKMTHPHLNVHLEK
ncbi:MAG: mechanosensitive ion channel family protein [Oscillospiraceae bacterium]|nr:mechanosensitive ion channel family protein [Oscillospiraceae bacterium]